MLFFSVSIVSKTEDVVHVMIILILCLSEIIVTMSKYFIDSRNF